MKTSVIALLSLGAAVPASAAPYADATFGRNYLKMVEKRQGGIMSMLSGGGQSWKVQDLKDLTPVYKNRPTSKRIKFTVGPFDVKPANATHVQTAGKMDPTSDAFSGSLTGLPSDITVLSSNSTITYKDGTAADVVNGIYNHHWMVLDTSKISIMGFVRPTFSCPDGSNAGAPISPFFGASEANRDLFFATADNNFNSGFYVGKKDGLQVSAELVNYSNQPKSIYVQTEIEYVPGKPNGTFYETGLQVLDAASCTNQSMMSGSMSHGAGGDSHGASGGHGDMAGMDMGGHGHGGSSAPAPAAPAKAYSQISPNIKINEDGFILFRRGHMHDGGDRVVFKVNGKSICDSVASYGGEGFTTKGEDGKEWATISNMKICTDPAEVKKGDIVNIEGHYDLAKHPAREMTENAGMGEQMGTMTFMFAPKPTKSWWSSIFG